MADDPTSTQPPVPLDSMLEDMLRLDASDLYITARARPKFSLQGNFVDAADVVLTEADCAAYADQLMSSDQKEEFRRELEVNLSVALGERARFRVNIFTQRGAVAIVIRLIKVTIPKLEELGLPPLLGELIMQDRGLLLMTGATGSGKSTTLAAMIDYRNERLGGHIVTIEDPIEFVHPNKLALVNQREVGIDTKSFHIALKNTLRQAPKIIYIGEIRDTETMGFALHASETGHLVLGTLHSNNANQTLERIMNFFPHDYHPQLLLQLSLNLRAVLSQRLLRKKEGGRVPALEILLNTPYIAELISKGDVHGIKHAMTASKAEGLQTFDQDIHRLWTLGLVTDEEAFRAADSANNLRLRMRGIGVGGQ
jgi:twitching motility protein PilU